MPQLHKGVVTMLAIAAIGFVAIIAIELLVPPSPEEQLRTLRSELARLRIAADSCSNALDREEMRLRDEDERLDSLKTVIDHYESLDPRGVPADSYETYLEAFNTYNESIPGRTEAGESLQAHWQQCRAIAEQHNVVADSARTLAAELGLLRDSLRIEPEE